MKSGVSGVYIIEDSSRNKNGNIFIKVGMSNVDVYKRIEKIKKDLHLCGMNSYIKVRLVIPCRQALKCEQLLHRLLKIYRVGTSEWHLISEDKLEEKLMVLNGELHRYK